MTSINDLVQARDRMVLRLRDEARDVPQARSATTQCYLRNLVSYFDTRQADIEETVNKVNTDPSTTEANKRKLDSMFDDMETELRKQRREAKDALDDMTPEEQTEFVTFFAGFTKFFTNLFAWVKNLVMHVVDLIKRGFNVVKDFFTGLFSKITDLFS